MGESQMFFIWVDMNENFSHGPTTNGKTVKVSGGRDDAFRVNVQHGAG